MIAECEFCGRWWDDSQQVMCPRCERAALIGESWDIPYDEADRRAAEEDKGTKQRAWGWAEEVKAVRR